MTLTRRAQDTTTLPQRPQQLSLVFEYFLKLPPPHGIPCNCTARTHRVHGVAGECTAPTSAI